MEKVLQVRLALHFLTELWIFSISLCVSLVWPGLVMTYFLGLDFRT